VLPWSTNLSLHSFLAVPAQTDPKVAP